MMLLIAAVLACVYVGNVLLGALAGAPVLDDVAEMLVLFAASIFFVAAILRREADAKKKTPSQQDL